MRQLIKEIEFKAFVFKEDRKNYTLKNFINKMVFNTYARRMKKLEKKGFHVEEKSYLPGFIDNTYYTKNDTVVRVSLSFISVRKCGKIVSILDRNGERENIEQIIALTK